MRIVLALAIVASVLAAVIGVLLLVVDDAGSPDELDPAPAGATAPAPRDPGPEPGSTGPTAPVRATRPSPAPPTKPTVPTRPASDPAAPRVVSAFRNIPIADARVVVWTDGVEPVEVRTDARGRIPARAGLAPGLNVRIHADRFRPLEASVEGEVEGRKFVLEPIGVIQGEVVDSNGTPQAWADLKVGVVIEDETGVPIGVPWSTGGRTTCNKQGVFRLEGLDPRGRYLIVASRARLGACAKADIVPVAPEGRRRVRLKLGGDDQLRVVVTDLSGVGIAVSRATLSGRPEGLPDAVVVGEAGRALVDAMRELRFRYRREMVASRLRLPDGRFGYGYVYDRVPAGDYVLEVEARGFKPYSAKIEIGPGGTDSHEARLEPEDVALTGSVVDAVGAPIAGADLSVHTDGDAYSGYRGASSEPDGSFAIHGPTRWVEPLVLQVAKSGYETTLTPVAPGTKHVSIRLHRSGVVHGEVAFEDKETGEVIFEFVRSKPQAALERRRHLVRRAWKQFRFTLPRGEYTVRFTAPGYRDHRASVTVPSGGDVTMSGVMLRRK